MTTTSTPPPANTPTARVPGGRRPALTGRPLLALAASLALLEGYDLACYGVTVPSLLADPRLGVTPAHAGTIGSLVAIGMLLGAAAAAVTVNRIGPRRLIIAAIGTFSLGMLLCALAPSAAMFGAGRFIVGLGLGIVLPTLIAYVAEMSEPGTRNRNIGILMAGYALGALVAPLLGAAILDDASYRWIYAIGMIPALALLPVAVLRLGESPVHLARQSGTETTAMHSKFSHLVRPPNAVATILFWFLSICGLFLVFGISTWLPTIISKSGYSLQNSLLLTAVMWVGAGVGMVLGGRVADAIGAKPVVAVAFLVGALSLLAMATRPPVAVLLILMFVSGLGLIGSQVLVNAYIVTWYPDALRGPAIGWALSIGRLGAIVGPIVGGALLAAGVGPTGNFIVFAIPGLLAAVATVLVPRRKHSLEPS